MPVYMVAIYRPCQRLEVVIECTFIQPYVSQSLYIFSGISRLIFFYTPAKRVTFQCMKCSPLLQLYRNHPSPSLLTCTAKWCPLQGGFCNISFQWLQVQSSKKMDHMPLNEYITVKNSLKKINVTHRGIRRLSYTMLALSVPIQNQNCFSRTRHSHHATST